SHTASGVAALPPSAAVPRLAAVPSPVPSDPDARALRAEIVALRWVAPEGGFAVASAIGDDGEELTLTGAIDHLHEAESVEVRGAWRRHAKHGWRFEVEHVDSAAPSGDAALLNVLGSIKHVGPSGAMFLLERHGPDVLEIVDADPRGLLGDVPGIGPARIGAATRSWERMRGRRALRLFLSSYGVPAAAAARIE